MKGITRIIIVLFMLVVCVSVSARTYKNVYKGTIAGKNVRVELYLDDDDYSVYGSYYYYNAKGQKLSAKLNLRGHCNPIGPARNPYYLTETTPNGQYCGEWNTNYNAETDRMTGTITNSKGKTYSINLRCVE